MAKVTLDNLSTTLTNSAATTINSNNDEIEAAFENTLSRDGTGPNQMESDLDMNHNDIYNVDNLHADVIVLNGVTIVPTEVGALPENVMLKSTYDPELKQIAPMYPDEYDPAGLNVDVYQMHNHRTLRASEIPSKSIPAVVASLWVTGYSLHGDGGHGVYVRVSTPSVVKPWHRQSFDGAWWDVGDQNEYAAQRFGLGSGETAATGFANAMDFITTRGGTLVFPAGEFSVPNYSFNSTGGPEFSLRGAGIDKTIFKKSAAASGAYFNFGLCTNLEISDMTINAQLSVVGAGSHALRLNQGNDITVRRVKVTDFTDTGIIFFNAGDFEAQHDNIIFDECVVEGLNTANNGLLISNSRNARMLNCNVFNLNKQGAPAFALQFKGRNSDGYIIGGTVNGSRGGVAMGSSDPVYPSNVDCHAIGVSIHGSTRGARIALSEYCTIECETIDMDNASDAGNPTEDAPEHAIFLSGANNCVIKAKHIRGYEDASYVVVVGGSSAGNTVVIDTWRNVPSTLNFLEWSAGASGNVCIVNNYVGTPPDFWMDRVNNLSASLNTFIVNGDVMAQRTTIASDAITILNPAVYRYRLDTEGAAASDNLITINGGTDGQTITLGTTNDARDVVVQHNTGNIFLKGAVNRTLGLTTDTMVLMYNSFISKWLEL